jgi:type IV pilus assembly protein PilV
MSHLSKGFTLIEILISVVIMAVGVLGATGLQLRGLDANRATYFRTEATHLANDIVNRMQVNSADYAIIGTPSTYVTGTPPVAPTNCTTTPCDPDQMAGFDLAQLYCGIRSTEAAGATHATCTTLGVTGSLPAGTATITRDTNAYTITIGWSDNKTGTSSLSLVKGTL